MEIMHYGTYVCVAFNLVKIRLSESETEAKG